jgi:hypothetical protein
VKFLTSIDGNTQPINPNAPGSLTLVNNFNYKTSSEAVQAAVAAYGSGLAASTTSATSTTVPSSIAGTTVAVLCFPDSGLCQAKLLPRRFVPRLLYEARGRTAIGLGYLGMRVALRNVGKAGEMDRFCSVCSLRHC